MEAHGEPIEMAVGAGALYVLARELQVGARPWEYYDYGYEQEGEAREHRIFVFKDGALLHHRGFSLGEHILGSGPMSIACFASHLLVPRDTWRNHDNVIQVWNEQGEHLQTVTVAVPPRLQPSPRSIGFLMEHLCTANGRLYVSSQADLLVLSWNGPGNDLVLLQSAHANDQLSRPPSLSPGCFAGRARKAMRPCIDEHHACMLTSYTDGPGQRPTKAVAAELFAVHGSAGGRV